MSRSSSPINFLLTPQELWTYSPSARVRVHTDLRKTCAHHGHILAVNVRTYNDYIVVADLMKSISILEYEELSESITEIARDYNTNWMTALEIIKNDLILGADSACNIFSVQR